MINEKCGAGLAAVCIAAFCDNLWRGSARRTFTVEGIIKVGVLVRVTIEKEHNAVASFAQLAILFFLWCYTTKLPFTFPSSKPRLQPVLASTLQLEVEIYKGHTIYKPSNTFLPSRE